MAGSNLKSTHNVIDVLGLDFGTTSTKLVRLRRLAGKLSLVEADVMPPFDLEEAGEEGKISLPKKLQAPYSAGSLSSNDCHVRFMFIPSKLADARAIRQRVTKSLGNDREQRVDYSMVERGTEGIDHKVLAASIPEEKIKSIRNMFPSQPSLISLEISGLAALNSFSHTPAVTEADGIVCYLEAGAMGMFMSFFLDGKLRLIRKFEHGSLYIQQRIQDVLNIDEDDALTVLFEDASPIIDQGVDPINTMTQEVSISCKFVERNESSQIRHVYASGGLSYSPYWTYMIEQTMGPEVQVWNPFTANGIKNIPKGVEGVESMFASAVGSALSVL